MLTLKNQAEPNVIKIMSEYLKMEKLASEESIRKFSFYSQVKDVFNYYFIYPQIQKVISKYILFCMIFFDNLLFDKHKEKFEMVKVDLMDLSEVFDNRDIKEIQATLCKKKIVERQSVFGL